MRQIADKLGFPSLSLLIYQVRNVHTSMPGNRHTWEEGLQKRAACIRDSSTMRLILTSGSGGEMEDRFPRHLSCLSSYPVRASICIWASCTAVDRSQRHTLSYTLLQHLAQQSVITVKPLSSTATMTGRESQIINYFPEKLTPQYSVQYKY